MLKALAIFCATALPLTAQAQSLDYASAIAEGSVQTISFSPQFEQRHGRELALHFTMDVPTNERRFKLQSNFAQPDRFGSIRFLTPDGGIAEMIDMFEGTIPAGPQETREEALASLLQNQVVPNLGTFEALNLLGARRAMVGPYSAIEVVALYTAEGLGQIGLRVVGVFPPAGENVLIFVSHTVIGVVTLPSVNDLPTTFAGHTLASVQFNATRAADGTLTPF